ncbi:flagellar basal-body rod protein FlgG [Geothrix limicola]|uniref:Flagellar basal-body rod protein FlgG n=1 Tax=Geothrix limicola TaxID=2927978 RepID=A0ABQ5QIQ0_9BACT|nr:flagellar basal-body rod protein FlgG [Geothrix limicola]GLH74558.1 flagellar basal-body rod protein FlgG [Geothrix limicola]
MMRAMWSAAAGMNVQQFNMDTISNNLANVNTTGYKKARAEFQDLLYQTVNLAGTSSSNNSTIPSGIQMGHGAKLQSLQRQYTTGNLRQTGNRFDMAIEGDGFFKVTTPDGTLAYTRDGSFTTDQNGALVNSSGYLMDPQITIPQDTLSVTVAPDGTVSVTQTGQTQPQVVGQITITHFVNPTGLNQLGRNLMQPTLASGDAIDGVPGTDGLGTINQGSLEVSNVDVAEEMVNMIIGQRAYEANSKTIQTVDNMLSLVNNLKR